MRGYSVQGTELFKYQDTGDIVPDARSLSVSPDGKYVCIPSGGGNTGAANGTYIYAVGNLAQPVCTISSSAAAEVVAFDPIQGLIFAQRPGWQLLVYDFKGTLVKEIRIAVAKGQPDTTRQFAVHPAGGKLLLLTDRRLMLVEYA
jgi:hypothetical protein